MVIQYEQDWFRKSIFFLCQAAVSERKSLRTGGWTGCSPAHTQKKTPIEKKQLADKQGSVNFQGKFQGNNQTNKVLGFEKEG